MTPGGDAGGYLSRSNEDLDKGRDKGRDMDKELCCSDDFQQTVGGL